MNSSAGILFAKYVKTIDDGIPIILQTTDKVIGEIAKDITDMFLNKNSTTLFYELRDFITKNFGFGDFIFENSKGEEILRANNIKTLLDAIKNIEKYIPLVDLIIVMTVVPGFGGQNFMENQLTKISKLNELRVKEGLEFEIEIDGGINNKTSRLCIDKGADVLVAGSYIYDYPESDYKKLINSLR